ncbi:MAG: 1-acyl-sn-glycerol-3-phosphate acyltransferase [Treponema sp.]|jgi:glycerol-3-phosphate O-acyltransferase|nr:1-acyl-sn-glycerol-3-phosphate acyltransferase [Treponema sp.]
METLTTAFRDIIKEAVVRSRAVTRITEDNVYQQGNTEIRPLLDKMVEALVLPGSGISGMENLRDLYQKSREGRSCLLLLEHYSNMDLSLFDYLVRREEGGEPIADSLVAIAGMKLTEDNPVVAAFASAYTRLVIYPSRSLQGLDPEKDRDELLRSASINRAVTKALIRIKEKGRIILVFPSGTRYRPWDPGTKQGVREIDSYIRIFDYMCPVAVNGEVLHVRQGDMMEDSVSPDLIRLTIGPVLSCTDFRNKAREAAGAAGVADKKQATVNAVMEFLEGMHTAAEAERQRLLKTQTSTPPGVTAPL